MRPLSFQRGYVAHPAGSCLVSCGNTRVLTTVCVEQGVPLHRKGKGGWLSAEYSMLPGSTHQRKKRDTSKPDGRGIEIQRLIGRSLRAAVDIDKLGEISLAIDCDVIQADGGTRTTSITGAWVALYDALYWLAKKQNKPGPEYYLLGQLAAVSVGIVDGKIAVDLDYQQDSRAEVDFNVVMRGGDFVEVQGTGEAGVFTREQLNALTDAASSEIAGIQAAQRKALGI